MTHEKVPTPSVLVVDDEPLIRWSLSEALTESGYAVHQAASGAEARAAVAAADHEAMIIILDLRLPDVPDLSLLREIRTARPDLPVVMMTAHGSAEDARQALALGAAQFVTKPFDVTEMVRLIGRLREKPAR
jgi:two-component system, NtrC family, response regulator AtoC